MQMTSSLSVPAKVQFKPRDYQERSIQNGLRFLSSSNGPNEIHLLPTGAGKSVCIGCIADRFEEPILVLQPSKEILKQNYAKYISYGGHAGIYSASVGRKDLGHVTFASIQSVMSRRGGKYLSVHNFMHYKHIIIDECHLATDAETSQVADFLDMITARHGHAARVLGFTATPFRLYPCSDRQGNKDSMLKMLTRTRKKIFGKIGYHVQVSDLLNRGFLAKARYFDVRSELSHGFDRSAIKVNSTGADYDEDALQRYYDTLNFKEDVVKLVSRINRTGKQVLCFMSSVADAEYVSSQIPNSATVSEKTPKNERDTIEKNFKSGRVRNVINCGVWQVGFDYPELKVVLLARPIRSLAMYYQMFGRALRPFNNQDAWLCCACGNLGVFGRIEELRLDYDKRGLPVMTGSNGKLLTGVPLKEQEVYVGEKFK